MKMFEDFWGVKKEVEIYDSKDKSVDIENLEMYDNSASISLRVYNKKKKIVEQWDTELYFKRNLGKKVQELFDEGKRKKFSQNYLKENFECIGKV